MRSPQKPSGDEYQHDLEQARRSADGTVQWVEVCFCETPLAEERPYWEKYFELLSVKDAHARKNCRDLNGSEPWACSNCDCTRQLEARLQQSGRSFLETLRGETQRFAKTPFASHPERSGRYQPGAQSKDRRGGWE